MTEYEAYFTGRQECPSHQENWNGTRKCGILKFMIMIKVLYENKQHKCRVLNKKWKVLNTGLQSSSLSWLHEIKAKVISIAMEPRRSVVTSTFILTEAQRHWIANKINSTKKKKRFAESIEKNFWNKFNKHINWILAKSYYFQHLLWVEKRI